MSTNRFILQVVFLTRRQGVHLSEQRNYFAGTLTWFEDYIQNGCLVEQSYKELFIFFSHTLHNSFIVSGHNQDQSEGKDPHLWIDTN